MTSVSDCQNDPLGRIAKRTNLCLLANALLSGANRKFGHSLRLERAEDGLRLLLVTSAGKRPGPEVEIARWANDRRGSGTGGEVRSSDLWQWAFAALWRVISPVKSARAKRPAMSA